MSSDPATEWAKATQEISKTAKAGIEIADKSRAFLYNIIGRHLETASETFIGEPLRLLAAKRHVRLRDRYYELLKEREFNGETIPVPLKIALPALEQGTLETDDSLQDLWANLLVTAGDPSQKSATRAAFVDIIKQLEPVDAKILHVAYDQLIKAAKESPRRSPDDVNLVAASPTDYPIASNDIIVGAAMTRVEYEQSVDNLTRVGCVAPYVVTEEFTSVINGVPTMTSESAIYRYNRICITALGVSFIEACVSPGPDRFEQLEVQKPATTAARPLTAEEGHRVHFVPAKQKL